MGLEVRRREVRWTQRNHLPICRTSVAKSTRVNPASSTPIKTRTRLGLLLLLNNRSLCFKLSRVLIVSFDDCPSVCCPQSLQTTIPLNFFSKYDKPYQAWSLSVLLPDLIMLGWITRSVVRKTALKTQISASTSRAFIGYIQHCLEVLLEDC